MCIICVELQKGTLAPWEASRNLREMSEGMDPVHVSEVLLLVRDLEQDFTCEWCDCDPCDCNE